MAQGTSPTRGRMIFNQCVALENLLRAELIDAYGHDDHIDVSGIMSNFTRTVIHSIMRVPMKTLESWAIDEMR